MKITTNHTSISERSRVAARYEFKLAILKTWILNGIPWRRVPSGEVLCDEQGMRLLEYFPTDVRALTAWNGERNTAGLLVAIKNETGETEHVALSSLEGNRSNTIGEPWHRELWKRCDSVLRTLAVKARSQLEEENKGALVKALRLQVKSLESLIEVQEKDICTLRLEQKDSAADLSKSQRALLDNLTEARRLVASRDEEIAQLKRERTNLVGLTAI